MAAAKEIRTPIHGMAPSPCAYRFGAFHLDPQKRLLTRVGKSVVLPPKVFDTLVALVESEGHPVENQALMARIWPGAPMEEGLLKFHVSQVRMALGDDKYIEALPPKGYRFIADLERIELAVPMPQHETPAAKRAKPLKFGKLLWGAVALAAASLGLVLFRSIDGSQEPPEHPLRSMAVAPFTSNSASDSSLAQAIANGLVPRLQSIPGMTVRLGQGGPGVEAVLSGELQRTPDRVVANVRLKPAAGGPEIFTESFDIPASQLFSIEPIVAKRVAIALKSRLTPAQEANLLRLPTQNSEAYRLYSELPAERGRIRQRISSLEKIVALDPEFAPAYAALADAYRTLAFSGTQISADTLTKSKTIAGKAVQLDGTLPDAHVALGYAHLFLDWNAAAAGKAVQRALELAPNSGGAHALNALLLTTQSKFDAALAEWRRASDAAPASEETRFAAAVTHYYARRYDRAIEEYRSAILKAPPVASAVQMLARSLRLKGQNADAFVECSRADAIAGVPGRPALKKAYEKEGFEGYWRKKLGQRNRMSSYETAVAYIEGGKEWRAFKPLAKAFESKSPEMIFAHIDPVMDSIRQDDRFKNMIREIGIAK